MYGTYPASLLGGESRVSTLFPPGAKIPKASGQALKWEQVKPMQGKALNPTTFESDYCALSHPFNNELARNPSLAARWRVSQNGYCSAEDQSVMKVKLLAHNSMWLMATLAILVIGLGAVFMGARAMRKRYIQA